jgi:threonylcarbamoyladenosine tRNA methylthiotransferase MtaB
MFGDAKLNLFSEYQIGKKTKFLFEKRNKQGLFEVYSSNFTRVQVNTDLDLSNQICEVYISSFENNKLTGELLQ